MTAFDPLDLYTSLLQRAWQRMVDLVGIHTVMVMPQRALWMTRQKYGEAELIHFDEGGFSFKELEILDRERLKALVEEFVSTMLGILAGLLGKEFTEKLAHEIDELLELTEVQLEQDCYRD